MCQEQMKAWEEDLERATEIVREMLGYRELSTQKCESWSNVVYGAMHRWHLYSDHDGAEANHWETGEAQLQMIHGDMAQGSR